MTYVLKKKEILIKLTGKAWQNFVDIDLAPKSKDIHTKYIVRFMKYIQAATPDNLLTPDNETLENKIVEMIKEFDADGLSTASQQALYAALKCFYTDGNRRVLAWGWITARIVKKPVLVKRAPTKAEIIAAIKIAKPREKGMTGLFTCTGMREGALATLKVKNYKLITDVLPADVKEYEELRNYKGRLIRCYEGFDEQYFTFSTPEVTEWIDEYLAARARDGEVITGDSPLFRDKYEAEDPQSVAEVIPVKEATIAKAFQVLHVQAGNRKRVKCGSDRSKCSRVRHEFKAVHGFRMYANTVMRNTKPKPDSESREMMLGHHPANLQKEYYDDTINDSVASALIEYLKAVRNLTIFDISKLESQNAQLKAELQTEKITNQQRIEELERLVGMKK